MKLTTKKHNINKMTKGNTKCEPKGCILCNTAPVGAVKWKLTSIAHSILGEGELMGEVGTGVKVWK